ncbi:MAG: hypothetical protein JWN98_736 [Abditibacteriota bacterium]|nr:hypothetical protein [Abditibacteriota bacterium]
MRSALHGGAIDEKEAGFFAFATVPETELFVDLQAQTPADAPQPQARALIDIVAAKFDAKIGHTLLATSVGRVGFQQRPVLTERAA